MHVSAHKLEILQPSINDEIDVFSQHLLYLHVHLTDLEWWSTVAVLSASVYGSTQQGYKVSGMQKVIQENYPKICVGGGFNALNPPYI